MYFIFCFYSNSQWKAVCWWELMLSILVSVPNCICCLNIPYYQGPCCTWHPVMYSFHAYMLSHFSHVRLFATLWTVALQIPLSMDSWGKNTEWVAVPSSRGSSWPKDWTHDFMSSALIDRFFITSAPGKFSSVQLFSLVQLFATPWTAAHQASLSITNSQRVLKLMSIESVMPSNHLILSHPRLLLPSIFLSIKVFSNESVLHIKWPKYWSFSFSINPFNEYSGLISFRIEWLDLFAVQGTLKCLLQHHSSKHQFFSAQLSL